MGGGSDSFREGDKVEADYRGRGKFYPGKISRDRGDDTYDIDYDDGERETRVSKRLIRSKDGGGSSRLEEGDKVEARYRGREKYYPGKITRDRGDGTYDISYDDGERETRVEERLIRKKDRDRSRSRSRGGDDRLSEGDKVEADYRGRGKFYPGKISRDRGDDTYDIAYDDGERETRVAKRLIRSKDGGGSSSDSFREGDKIEVRYRGREKYYPGKIDRDRRDGTYDIAYDDGERETRVEGRLIRAKESSSSSSGEKFYLGDKVDARYRGREKYYPGKVGWAHADGTYDIDYDDGEKETRVEGRLLRRRGGGDSPRARSRSPERRSSRERSRERSRSRRSPSPRRRSRSPSPRRSSGSGAFREGDRVEARFRGREKYYPGTIRTDRGNGTYDVSYDDGATETRVREDHIRSRKDDDGPDLRSGDACEARYRGRDKWYPGTIKRKHSDGTFDIDYDDGESERNVKGGHVREKGRRGRSRSPNSDDDEARKLRRKLRDLEDKITTDRARSLSRSDDRRRSRSPDDIESLKRENRELRKTLQRGGATFGATRSSTSRAPPWHGMVNQDDDVIDELVGAIGTSHGSVGQWLNTSATPLEKRNFVEFVQCLEEFEGRHGLTPANRSADDVSGTINLALGPTIKCSLKFLV